MVYVGQSFATHNIMTHGVDVVFNPNRIVGLECFACSAQVFTLRVPLLQKHRCYAWGDTSIVGCRIHVLQVHQYLVQCLCTLVKRVGDRLF